LLRKWSTGAIRTDYLCDIIGTGTNRAFANLFDDPWPGHRPRPIEQQSFHLHRGDITVEDYASAPPRMPVGHDGYRIKRKVATSAGGCPRNSAQTNREVNVISLLTAAEDI
jgi:hypothetical protein